MFCAISPLFISMPEVDDIDRVITARFCRVRVSKCHTRNSNNTLIIWQNRAAVSVWHAPGEVYAGRWPAIQGCSGFPYR